MADSNMNGGSSWSGWFRYRYDEDQETSTDIRNVRLILVALILIVAGTFQAGVNPRDGVRQDDSSGRDNAGMAIYDGQKLAFYFSLIVNTLALSMAMLINIPLAYKFPFHVELWIATFSMFSALVYAIFTIAQDESIEFRSVLCAVAVMPFVIQGLKKLYRCHMLSN